MQTAIDILHAQPEPLDQTHAAAIQELRDPLVDACGGHDDALDLVCGQHDEQCALLVGPHGMDAGVIQRDAEDLSGEKQQGVQGLRLRRAGHIACQSERGQKRLDLSWPHLLWVACVVAKERPSHPVAGGACGTNRGVCEPDDFLSPIESFLRGPRSMRTFDMDVFRLHTGSPWPR